VAYSALPDRRIPYDNDGTVMYQGTNVSGPISATSQASMSDMNDMDETLTGYDPGATDLHTWLFFPESREVTGMFYISSRTVPLTTSGNHQSSLTITGSNDSTNGLDGTWETASLPGGMSVWNGNGLDCWRAGIKAVSFTGGKRVLRFAAPAGVSGPGQHQVVWLHVYGEKVTGQTPDDLIYIDHDTTPGVEYTAPEDFGDRPLGTTVTRQFRVKNASATLTANTINLQCNDSDFVISENGTSWVTTINISSLAAGAESATLYVRNTTPNPGNLLGPRFARIVTTVASWT
jgi:hypothetical protein